MLCLIGIQIFILGCNDDGTPTRATMVLKNGMIYTMDENDTVASAIAIDDDTILYVGDDETVEKYVGKNTEVIDLEGKMALPGFVDGHGHPPGGQLQSLTNLMLGALEADLDVYRDALRAYAKEHEDDAFLSGKGLQINLFGDAGPNKSFIDEIVSDKPVLLSDTSGHGVLINSYALEMSGITSKTENPPGGTIFKDEFGEPTGYLSDARDLLHPDLLERPEITTEVFMKAWEQYEDESLSKGITAATNAAADLAAPTVWPIMDDYAKKGKLRMRVNFLNVAYPDKSAEEAIQELNDGQQYVSDWQAVCGVKTFLDGVPEGKTSYLLEPYALTAGEDADYRGTCNWDEDAFKAFFAAVDAAGYQMQAHCMGDASSRLFIDAVEDAYQKNGEREARHTLVHANLIYPTDIPRMGAMDIYAAMQPIWFYADPIFAALELQMLGQERFDQEYSIRDMLESGIHISGSADQPVTPDDRPLAGIETGVTQGAPYPGIQGDDAYVRDASQTATVMEMLRMYTINGAKQMFMEHLIGSLECDKKADIVILEKDITMIDPVDIAETVVVTTIVNGKKVYEME